MTCLTYPCVYATMMSFWLNYIIVFYLLTLPRQLLTVISVKFRIFRVSQCYRVGGPKPWQSLNHSCSSIPEQYERVDSGSITFVHRIFIL